MTMTLFSGTPGSGKSLAATERIYKRLKRGLPVISNYPLDKDKIPNPELFTFVDNSELNPYDLVRYSREYFAKERFGEDKILFVWDECSLQLNSRDWRDGDRPAWLSFFQQHRKFGYSIILIAQFDLMIDKQVRSLLDYEYVHRKVSNFGVVGWCMSLLFAGRAHVQVQMYYPLKKKVGSRWFMARRKYFEMYDSYGAFARLEESAPLVAATG